MSNSIAKSLPFGFVVGSGAGTESNPFVFGDYPAPAVRLVSVGESGDTLDDLPCRSFQVITAGIVEIWPLRLWNGTDNDLEAETPLVVDLADGDDLPTGIYPIMAKGFTENTTATILAYR